MLFLESRPRVALEVGTGCSVFVENTAGFEDYGVRTDACDHNQWHSQRRAVYMRAGVEYVA